jgi:hypothetical protein
MPTIAILSSRKNAPTDMRRAAFLDCWEMSFLTTKYSKHTNGSASRTPNFARFRGEAAFGVRVFRLFRG